MRLYELEQRLKRVEEENVALRTLCVEKQNQTPPSSVPVLADVFITPKSAKRMKQDIVRYLN